MSSRSRLHHVIEQKQSTITLLGWPTDIIDYNVNIINDDGHDGDDYNDDNDNDNDVSHPNYDPNYSKSKSKSTTTKSVPVQTADQVQVHTILIWIPGNPGQHNWYHSDFKEILSALGQGYAIHSISHAGHNVFNSNRNSNSSSIVNVEEYCRDNNEANASIPWTVDGQVLHKIAYIDNLLSKLLQIDKDEIPRQHQQTQQQQHRQQQHTRTHQQHRRRRRRSIIPNKMSPKFIFVGHSFGCHVIQRMCVLRPDILERTRGFLFLMPYIRTFPNKTIDQRKLNWGAGNCNPNHLINISTTVSQTIQSYIPEWSVRSLIRHGINSDDDEIIKLATQLVQQPTYPQNFFQLGTEEIRDIPNEIDVNALRILSSISISLTSSSSSTSSFSLVDNDNDNTNKIRERQQQRQRQRRFICILYAGDNDQWCPSFHGEEIKKLQSINILPSSIKLTKLVGGVRHDYVCQNQATRSKVNQWCISNISRIIMNDNNNNENSNTNSENESNDNNITTATATATATAISVTNTINNHTNVGSNSQSNAAPATRTLASRL